MVRVLTALIQLLRATILGLNNIGVSVAGNLSEGERWLESGKGTSFSPTIHRSWLTFNCRGYMSVIVIHMSRLQVLELRERNSSELVEK